MGLIITPFYAALGTFFYIFMAKKVIDNRWKYKKGLGTVEGELEQAIRAHANYAEYTPHAFVMIAFLELQNWNPGLIHGLCLFLLICRVLHFTGLTNSNGPSKGRFYGTAGTFLTLAAASGCAIYAYVSSLIG